MSEKSLLERFLTEKPGASVRASSPGVCQLSWRDGAASREHYCTIAALDIALSEALGAADEKWLTTQGLRRLIGDTWVRGNAAVYASSGRKAVLDRLADQEALAASGEWRAVTPGVWARDTSNSRLVYEGPTGRLTTTTTRTVTPAEVSDLCK